MPRTTTTRTTPSIYETVTARIIDALERGALPWQRPSRVSTPANAVTGRVYRGINALVLGLTTLERAYTDHRWLTYVQAKRIGAQVRRGEKATPVVWWMPIDRHGSGADGARDGRNAEATTVDEAKRDRLWICRTFHVFNLAQVDGIKLDAPEGPGGDATAPAAEWERIVSSYGADIRHGGEEAYYSPHGDYIQMPHRAAFHDDQDGYYGTLAHELVHHTGAPHRLDRNLTGRFGSEAYAFEELVAEMGSAFLTARFGTAHRTAVNAAYLASWLKVLRADQRAIFTAARLAQQAADYIAPAAQEEACEDDVETVAAAA